VKPRRVVITGIGVVTPIGTGRDEFWSGLQGQVSRVEPITRFDPSPFRTRMAGEVPDFRPADHIEARRVRRFDRFAQFGVAATRLALADSAIDLAKEDGERIGSSMGTALAGVARAEEEHGNYMRGGLRAVDPSLALAVFGGAASCNVAIEFGLSGPNTA
jgi:3-oxoacyl-[acyl-carrier-protein] synthase II